MRRYKNKIDMPSRYEILSMLERKQKAQKRLLMKNPKNIDIHKLILVSANLFTIQIIKEAKTISLESGGEFSVAATFNAILDAISKISMEL